MEYTATVNGIANSVYYRDEDVNQIFLPLLKTWKALQEDMGRRIMVFVAAPPGAGKSTLLGFLKELSRRDDLTSITTIGIDGFHHYQEFLDTHMTVRDGQEIPMAKVKGAPETFDRELLEQMIADVATGS